MTGIAHVSFRGGGMFLPARSPYDRQTLIEHITDRVRAKGDVQVLLHGQRWMVHLHRGQPPAYCTCCGTAVHCACHSTGNCETVYCVNCAFGADTASMPVHQERQRQAG